MAVPLFTVLLNNYTFFLKKFNYGVKLENCNLIVRGIDYFQCSISQFAMQASGDIHLKPSAYYKQEILFSPSTAMKSQHAYYTRDFTVMTGSTVCYHKCLSKS